MTKADFLQYIYVLWRNSKTTWAGNAVVNSLAQSMKKLADAIHNCRIRPIIKADVMLNDEKVNFC